MVCGVTTVTTAEPVLAVFTVEVAVIVAVPAETPVTVALDPEPDTDATALFELNQVTVCAAPPETLTLALSVVVEPVFTEAVLGETVTLLTTAGSVTVIPPFLPQPFAKTSTARAAHADVRRARNEADI